MTKALPRIGFVLAALVLLPGVLLAAERKLDPGPLSPLAMRDIAALQREKNARTPAQRKIDSRLLYAVKASRDGKIARGVSSLQTGVEWSSEDRRTIVDIICDDAAGAHARLQSRGIESGTPVGSTIRARVSPGDVERIASWPEVRFVTPMLEYRTNGYGVDDRKWKQVESNGRGFTNSEGERTHRADAARRTYGSDGRGVKVGVISNGVDWMIRQMTTGDLPVVNILPGQAGIGNEGSAMLEIIHDLAPRAELYFATAVGGPDGFAQNIRALRAAGCDIIVDDVGYFNESPFQDGQAANVQSNTLGGVIAQAVNDVTADGALYFSSAGNGGNLNDGTSAVYEGDFVSGGTLPQFGSATVHSFGPGLTYNEIQTAGPGPVSMFWSDPLGGSTNDYDLYLLDSTGTRVVGASTNVQNGTQDPWEILSGGTAHARVVVVKHAGAQDRYLHIEAFGRRLAVATSGTIWGHASGKDAFAVAATPADVSSRGEGSPTGPFPGVFTSSNVVERFSSDGLRQLFYKADSTPITPGDLMSTGGEKRQKPDITAADGVSCSTPGFARFFGTSAASPHAAAIAALLKSAVPTATPTQIRAALIASAIDIEAPGVDRDSGAGIIMVPEAMQALGAQPHGTLVVSDVGIADASCGLQSFEPGERVSLGVCLRNVGGDALYSVMGTLEGQGVSNATPQMYGPMFGESGDTCRVFTFTVSAECGGILAPVLRLADGPLDLGPLALFQTYTGTHEVEILEGFMRTTAPEGWSTTSSGAGEPFTFGGGTFGQGAMVTGHTFAGDSSLISPSFLVKAAHTEVGFAHTLYLGGQIGFDSMTNSTSVDDGGVLEIEIDGVWRDIIEAGGTFVQGGYNAVTSFPFPGSEPNPLGFARKIWGGDSGGSFFTIARFPPSVVGKTVRLRWRAGFDGAFSATGAAWTILSAEVHVGVPCEACAP